MQETNWKLKCLFEPLEGLTAFRELTRALKAPGVCSVYGPDDAQRAHLLAAAALKLDRPLLVISPNDITAARMTEDLNVLLSGAARQLPARDITFLKTAASSRELSMRRIEALGDCLCGGVKALVVPADALPFRLAPAADFAARGIALEEGAQMEPAELMERLTAAGYERVHLVEARGQCALRGGILDVYPVGGPNALRVEFFDDVIDSIRSFDVMTQRSISRRSAVKLYPAQEILLDDAARAKAADALQAMLDASESSAAGEDRQAQIEQEFDLIPFEEFMRLASEDGEGESAPKKKGSGAARGVVKLPRRVTAGSALRRNFGGVIEALRTGRLPDGADSLLPVLLGYEGLALDYLKDPVIVFDQPDRLRERCENRFLEFKERFVTALERQEALPCQAEIMLSYDALLARLGGKTVLLTNLFMRTEADFKPTALIKVECRNASAYQGNVKELARDLTHWKEEGWKVALLAGGTARGERLQGALDTQGSPAPFVTEIPEALEAGAPQIFPLTLNRGFLYPEVKFAVVAESDIYGVNRQKSRSRANRGEKIAAFTDLKVGDYVVHENHGIGQYMGMVRLASDGTYRDFLHIRYQGSDKLYVPTDQLDRVQKYIGSEGEAPKLNRLSGGEWQRQKSKVRQSIQAIAGDLLKLYAQREAIPGYAFEPDTPWQREFEDGFPYEETPDQLTAIDEIKRDMEKPKIMDRLLCGDVGYGKTEVALRAIFKCVMSGKQAAMLAPTTILVQQHYATMLNRFAGFPIRVETISRFKTAAEQKKILERLAAGELDVVVGTHRLLAKDVKFKDLGLLVVDEEQRFGVTHKEAIKQMKRSVDVLTLTATPIPRTLHMSMVGIRDMSLLQSPPEERYPVQTYVVEYSDGLVRDAILRELSRGGQVYVLHNRVQTIEVMYARLKKLVPEARIAIGHGQMREHALEDVMLDFYDGKFDVLLCTTIIEAGLDVPRANTLIVCDADRFGLAQLYQLRGRVGRSNRLAYAYLTVNPSKVLTESADKRLAAIREFTEFGSGFRVAMRDLEIRGAGNLLGSEQSGFMATVGYDLYVKMIEETVRQMRGDVNLEDIETRVDLKVDAYLPQEYIANDLLRVEMYKKIASIRDRDSREDLIEELIDRFGDPNRPVMNLIDAAHLKALCARLGIDYVTCRGDELIMRFSMAADIDLVRVLTAVKGFPQSLRVKGGNPPELVYFERHKDAEALLRGAVKVMEGVVEKFDQGSDRQ
ncbi:MAG: transcription-repair coupling factor [Clostridia bacterium]|nr:transcription-repair coupling factor [Clostridia bacterium]